MMNEHKLFYYPYASFADTQLPLLKVAALYFDRLFILDPEKATGGAVGPGQIGRDILLLEQEGILVRVSPEDVLAKYEQNIADAIRGDLGDRAFTELCEQSGRAQLWTLALAKVPREIREDPRHREYARRKPVDQAMQRFMGELPRKLAGDAMQYMETYAESTHNLSTGEFVYDEYRESEGREIEYRYADYPLPLGEAIMMNHALFGGLLYQGATPITDDPFHSRALALKLERASRDPDFQHLVADRARARQLRADRLALTALADTQLSLPILNPDLPLTEVLEYRQQHDTALKQAREKLGWMARRIEAEPWSPDFADEIEHHTIPEIARELEEARKARDTWLRSRRGRLALSGTGVAVGAAAAALSILTAPLTPVALATAGLSLISGAALPGAEWLIDWRDGKKTMQENGLHYLLQT